jgi:hypothetical protein
MEEIEKPPTCDKTQSSATDTFAKTDGINRFDHMTLDIPS